MKKSLKAGAVLLATVLLGGTLCAPVSAEKNAYRLGDVNNDGNVDMKDAMIALREYSLQLAWWPSELSADEQRYADIDGDGIISLRDAMMILTYWDMNLLYPETTWETHFDGNPSYNWDDIMNADRGNYNLIFDDTIGDYVLIKKG